MPLCDIKQPEVIQLTETLRLKKYDGHYEEALIGYQDPYVYQNSEGIFDDAKKPDLNYVKGMCKYLNRVGELYFIEIWKNGKYISIGDVTVKPENPPIAIWFSEYRGKGIGTLVMRAVIERLRDLGYQKITGSTVYKWNKHSLSLHQKMGFQVVAETEEDYILELGLCHLKELETKRLILRPLTILDFEDFQEYAMDDELSYMYGLPLNKDSEKVFKIFNAFLNGRKTYALIYKENGKMIGHLMIVPPELPAEEIEKLGDKKGVTLAFAIAPHYQRKGFMYEALKEVVNDLFGSQNYDYIHCGYYEFNNPSKKLQEKLGSLNYSSHIMKQRDKEIKIIDNLLFRKHYLEYR